MQKAGGIISIIAGIFGLLAAGATLLIGGVGSAFDAKDADTVVGLGWGGVVFSFLVIILGAIAISAETRKIGTLLIVSSIAGAILGGTLVALFMALSLIGGILATVSTKGGSRKDVQAGDESQHADNGPDLRRTSRSVARQKEEVAVSQAITSVDSTPVAMDGHAEKDSKFEFAVEQTAGTRQVESEAIGTARASEARMKQCPFCAEEIRLEAIKCKHCGSALEPVAGIAALTQGTADEQAAGAADARRGGAKRWIVAAVAAVVAIVAVVLVWAFVGQRKQDSDAAAVTVEPSNASESQVVDVAAQEAEEAILTAQDVDSLGGAEEAAAEAMAAAAAAEAAAGESVGVAGVEEAASSAENCEQGASNMAEVFQCEFVKTEKTVDQAELELRAVLSRGGFYEQQGALRRSQEEWRTARDADCQQDYDEAFKEVGGYAEGNRLECIRTHNQGRVEELRAYAEICSSDDRSACVI